MGHHTRGPHATVGGAASRLLLGGLQTRPGCRSITTDTCVPISRLAEINESVGGDAAGLPYFIVGHVATATSTSPTCSTRPSPRSARPPSA